MHRRPQIDCRAGIAMTQDERQVFKALGACRSRCFRRLPKAPQRFVIQMIDTVLAQQDR